MRILITGPESSGKSTMAAALSTELDIPFIPEFARTYLEKNGPGYTLDSIITIAVQHHKIVESQPLDSSFILDTYMYNLAIWAQDKFGHIPEIVKEVIDNADPLDFIFIMYPDTPWTADGLREDADRRVELFDKFKDLLDSFNTTYHVITGVGQSRLENILHHLK